MAFRIDKGKYSRGKAQTLRNGFLLAPATVTRTGVFVYRDADGSERRELRLPEEVFNPDSLKTLHLAPITREHPGRPVDVDNDRHLSIGTTGQDARADGDNVVSTLLLKDRAAIAEAESGKRSEVSCGYWCDHEMSPGTYKGEHYDCIQRNIEYNHVAMTVKGRAGNARIHLDSVDSDWAEMVVSRCDAEDPQTDHTKERQAMKLTIDGITFETEDAQLAQAVGKALGDRDAKISALTADSAKLSEDKSKAEARADAAEKDRDKEKAAREDSEKPEKVQELVKDRLNLERRAGPLLADSLKKDKKDLADLSDDEIRRAVIGLFDPDMNLDGKDAAYVSAYSEAAFRFLAERKDSDASKSRHRAEDALGGRRTSDDSEADEAEKQYRKDMEDAWKEPLHKTGS